MSAEEEKEPSWTYCTFTVPNISDNELKCLAVCSAALNQFAGFDPQAKKRILEYLLARNTQ